MFNAEKSAKITIKHNFLQRFCSLCHNTGFERIPEYSSGLSFITLARCPRVSKDKAYIKCTLIMYCCAILEYLHSITCIAKQTQPLSRSI
jgi:hypothetical protein